MSTLTSFARPEDKWVNPDEKREFLRLRETEHGFYLDTNCIPQLLEVENDTIKNELSQRQRTFVESITRVHDGKIEYKQ